VIAFAVLDHEALIGLEGADAVTFLHAQVTSDVTGLPSGRTQYSGYCSPKGRLLATFLIWKETGRLFIQLPRDMREALQSRLAKYVLRSKVKLTDATGAHVLFGVWGAGAAELMRTLGFLPEQPHEIVAIGDAAVTKLPMGRYLIRTSGAQADEIRAKLDCEAAVDSSAAWALLDIEAGVPVLTPATQDEYVPQMVNLDLIGGVSYSKGCYPGQEIVARTHYLGRLKQRTYRVRVESSDARVGDPLYSAAFGADQASGAILNVIPSARGGADALAVLQTAAATSGVVHWRAADGPAIEFQTLPYSLPE
jgi:folate-binding protein YgfZ